MYYQSMTLLRQKIKLPFYKNQRLYQRHPVREAKTKILRDQDQHEHHNCIQEYDIPRFVRRRLPVNTSTRKIIPNAFHQSNVCERVC